MDKEEDTNNTAFYKIKQSLAFNFYSILSLSPCQVKKASTTQHHCRHRERTIHRRFRSPFRKTSASQQNSQQVGRQLKNRHSIRTHKTAEARFHHLFHDNTNLRRGVLDGSIPSAVAESGASSSVGTETNLFLPTGRPSHKIFRLPNDITKQASRISQLATKV